MHDYPIDPADEGRHDSDDQRFWNESYYFDFHDEAGVLGGYVRIGLYPNLGATWYWACVVGADRPLVTVIDHAAPLPEPGSLHLRGQDFEARNGCDEPTRSFHVGVEAHALAFDDPADVYGPLRGTRVPLTLDLHWETDGPGGTVGHLALPGRIDGQAASWARSGDPAPTVEAQRFSSGT